MFSLYGFFFMLACGAVVLACAALTVIGLFNDPTDWRRWVLAVLFSAFLYKESRL